MHTGPLYPDEFWFVSMSTMGTVFDLSGLHGFFSILIYFRLLVNVSVSFKWSHKHTIHISVSC